MWACRIGGVAPWGWAELAVVITFTLLVAWLVRAVLGRPCAPSHPARTAAADRIDSLAIIKMRLARGEISREDYLAMKKALED